jgi:hypothetical protein
VSYNESNQLPICEEFICYIGNNSYHSLLNKGNYFPVVVSNTIALALHETAADVAAIAIVSVISVGRLVFFRISSKNLEWKKALSASLHIYKDAI